MSFEPFYFIHYSDPQIGRNSSAQPNVETAINQIGAMEPLANFIVLAGDLGNNPENQSAVLNQWQICDSLFSLLPIPKYCAPGNNDVGYEDESCWTPAQLQMYRNFWGPDYYSFDADSCHFIALNSTLLDTYSPHACYPYSLEQDSFLLWDLQNIQYEDYKHLFFFFHFPLYQSSPYDPNGHSVVDRPRRDSILQYLIEYNFTATFTGHWHQDYVNFYWPALLQTGISTCNTGSSNGYRIVKVFENGIETFRVLLYDPVDTLSLQNIVTAVVNYDTVSTNVPVSFTSYVDSINFPNWINLSYKWQFGDGDSASTANTTHTYSDTGHYEIIFSAHHPHDKCALYKFNIVVFDPQYVQESVQTGITSELFNLHVFSNIIDIHLLKSGPVTLDLYQSDGRLLSNIHRGYLDKGTHRFMLDKNTPSGIYFVRIKIPQGSATRKFVYIH